MLLANRSRVYRFLLTRVPNREHAEDWFQQTCFTLWHHWKKFDPKAGEFVSWDRATAHGSSGVQIRFETDLVIEAIRPTRVGCVRPETWRRVQLPLEKIMGSLNNAQDRFPTPAIFPKY